jgi:hypothetical protein
MKGGSETQDAAANFVVSKHGKRMGKSREVTFV